MYESLDPAMARHTDCRPRPELAVGDDDGRLLAQRLHDGGGERARPVLGAGGSGERQRQREREEDGEQDGSAARQRLR
jgi:hypothetical protein